MAQTGKLSRQIKREDLTSAIDFAKTKIAELEIKHSAPGRLQAYQVALGKIYYKLGEHTDAEKQYTQALESVFLKKRSGKKLKLPDFDVMDDLALFYVNKGNFLKAQGLIDSSLNWRITKLTKNDPTHFRPYLPLGLLHYYKGQPDSADYYLTVYQKNIRNSNYTGFLDINRYADTYQITSEIELSKGNLKRARRLAKKTVRLQNHRWTKKESGKNYLARIKALNTLSLIHRLDSSYKKARHFNTKALALHDKKYDSVQFDLIPLYINKAFIDYKLNPVEHVKTDLARAMIIQQNFILNNFNYLSEYEKENIYRTLKSSNNEILALTIKMYQDKRISGNDPLWQDILDFILNTKAPALSESNKIFESIHQGRNPELKELYDRWKKLKNEWVYVTNMNSPKSWKNAGEILSDIVLIEKQMGIMVHSMDAGIDQKINWIHIRDKLQPNEAAVEITRIDMSRIGPESGVIYSAFIILPKTENPEIIVMQNGVDLEQKWIVNYYNSVQYDIEDTISYTQFWQTIEAHLTKVNRVFVSADGIFHLVNFNVLKNKKGYLIDQIEIINLTKLDKVIDRREIESQRFTSAALIGSPDFTEINHAIFLKTGSKELSPLPGAETEIYTIADLLKEKGIAVSSYLHDQATETAVKQLPGSDILHFATHGYFDDRSGSTNPMLNSGLILSVKQDPDNDGLLTAYEASTLSLATTQLAVLSACKTGLGSIRDGEGVYGLQRAFEAAGVKNIIISLWSIKDEIAREFMFLFYLELLNTNDVIAAFQKAQTQTRMNHPNPGSWGAFKLITSY